MKKYLQACEAGGSIYGKSKGAAKRCRAKDSATGKKDLAGEYNKFYKQQLNVMDRLFRRGSS
ncbi:MAG: hypothetical protein ABIA77_06930 [Candidatus Omnitrophota bacterium]